MFPPLDIVIAAIAAFAGMLSYKPDFAYAVVLKGHPGRPSAAAGEFFR